MSKIIDGVDVSGCEHYRAEIETKMPYGEYEIQKDKCYYSGIEIIQNCKGIKGCIYKQLQRAKVENERLKEEITKLSDPRYQISKVNEGYYNRMNTYKQALQEIREIIDFRFKTSYMTLGFKEYDELIEDIDKIVNEVIGAE